MKPSLLGILTLAFLALFAGIWIWIGWELWHFTATPEHPKLDLSDAVVTVAGFIASAVAAGTASVLGIEIQKADSGNTLAARVGKAATDTKLLAFGILLYAGVGAFVLLVWLGHSEQAPDLLGAFSLGVLGWFAGAFAAVFRKAQ
jgi:cation transporter-like permease